MVSIINEKYLDVDFQAEAKRLDNENLCGALPRKDKPGDMFPIFEDRLELIPESDWRGLIEHNVSMTGLIYKIKNQGREGTCTANAQSQWWEMEFVRQFGVWIELSAVSVYRQVAPGPNSGSGLGEVCRALQTTGGLPTDSIENRATIQRLGIPVTVFHPNTGYYTRPADGWKETAKLFRVDEQHEVLSFEGMVTSLHQHHPVIYARAGHCILAVEVLYENGQFIIKYANSWGKWGDRGYGYDSRSTVEGGVRRYGAIAGRSVVIPPGLVFAKAM